MGTAKPETMPRFLTVPVLLAAMSPNMVDSTVPQESDGMRSVCAGRGQRTVRLGRPRRSVHVHQLA